METYSEKHIKLMMILLWPKAVSSYIRYKKMSELYTKVETERSRRDIFLATVKSENVHRVDDAINQNVRDKWSTNGP